MRNKKWIAIIFVVCLSFATLVSCGKTKDDKGGADGNSAVYCTVTFETLDGKVKKQVVRGGELTDIPTLPTEKGYTYTWSVVDFSSITTDVTVTLVKTANEYTIFYDTTDMDGTFKISKTEQKVTYGQPFTLEIPSSEFCSFLYWVDENGQKFESGTYNLAKDITLTSVWEEEWSGIG